MIDVEYRIVLQLPTLELMIDVVNLNLVIER
jgi:hypothetical protein